MLINFLISSLSLSSSYYFSSFSFYKKVLVTIFFLLKIYIILKFYKLSKASYYITKAFRKSIILY